MLDVLIGISHSVGAQEGDDHRQVGQRSATDHAGEVIDSRGYAPTLWRYSPRAGLALDAARRH